MVVEWVVGGARDYKGLPFCVECMSLTIKVCESKNNRERHTSLVH